MPIISTSPPPASPSTSSRRATRASSSSPSAPRPPNSAPTPIPISHLASSPSPSITSLKLKLSPPTSITSKRALEPSPTRSTPGKHRRTSSSSPSPSPAPTSSASVESARSDSTFSPVQGVSGGHATGVQVEQKLIEAAAAAREQIELHWQRAKDLQDELDAKEGVLMETDQARIRAEDGQAEAKAEQATAECERDQARAEASGATEAINKMTNELDKPKAQNKELTACVTRLEADKRSLQLNQDERDKAHTTQTNRLREGSNRLGKELDQARADCAAKDATLAEVMKILGSAYVAGGGKVAV